MHVLPLQQPLGHDVASHTQPLPSHRCPLLHTEQLPPPVPHADVLWPFEHVVELTQQPLAHELGVHTHTPPELHVSPVPQAWQLAPPTPHVPALDVRH
jgi:hypothetical protein